jgi:hypothetical protein
MMGPSSKKYGTITEWTNATGMSRSGTYLAGANGHLVLRKVGGRTLVDFEQGLAWLDSLPKLGAPDLRPAPAPTKGFKGRAAPRKAKPKRLEVVAAPPL